MAFSFDFITTFMFAFVWCSASYSCIDCVGLFVFMLGDCFRVFELRFVLVPFRGRSQWALPFGPQSYRYGQCATDTLTQNIALWFCRIHFRPVWPLSQTANKSNVICSICLATRQLHLRDGTVHRHGPRHNPCSGSGKPPLDSSTHHPIASQSSSSIVDSTMAADQSIQSAAIWSPADVSLIKHIPKSTRGAFATHLSSLLRKIVSSPDSVPNWLALLNWGCTVLQRPKRGGKRHNLARTIKQRISSFSAGSAECFTRLKC